MRKARTYYWLIALIIQENYNGLNSSANLNNSHSKMVIKKE